jgi:hypothetical protein
VGFFVNNYTEFITYFKKRITNMSQYEQLIEFIINEQEDKARELFHQIVVGKSREIYESLMDGEDFGGNEVEELEGQITGDETGLEHDDAEFGMGDEEGSEEGLEGRVMDLEAELEDLKADFAALMADEEGEPEHHDGVNDPDFADAEEDGEEASDDEESEEDMFAEGYEEESDDEEDDEEEDLEESRKPTRRMTEAEWIREYVEKIGEPYSQQPAQGEGHEVGKGKKASVAAKSIVAGKNDMGGSTKNIARGGANENPDNKPVPKASNEYTKGEGKLKGAGKFQNVPGGNAGKSTFKTKEGEYSTEHGAEGQTTDGKVSVEKKSVLKKISK